MVRGRKPGYKHEKETKEKIRQTMTGHTLTDTTKLKIKQSLTGKFKSEEHRSALSESLSDLDRKCMHRFLEMRDEYPGQEEFFNNNKNKLLYIMRDLKSEKELRDIKKYIEIKHLDDIPQECTKYQYDSSSMYAQEDAMIALVDAASFLKRHLSTIDKNALPN